MMANKKMTQVLMSSDEEDDSMVASKSKRSSQRLKKRKSQSSFVMPSRDKVWDTIPTTSTPDTIKLKSLSPMKSMNDFTKVYNTYNFDDYEDSSDDENEGFVTDSSCNNTDNSSDTTVEKRTPGRVKNYRRRIRRPNSSSDEENDGKDQENPILCVETGGKPIVVENSRVSDEVGEKTLVLENDLDRFFVNNRDSNVKSEESSGSDEGISPVKRRRTTLILESDEGSESSNSNSSGPSQEDIKESRSLIFKKKKDELFQRFKDIQKEKKALQKT